MKLLDEWLASATVVKSSSYPQAEKDRHYKEILAQMRSQGASFENDPAFREVYDRIMKWIGHH